MKEVKHKRPHIYDSIYMKYPKQANPQEQNEDLWLPRAKGKGNDCLMGTGFPFGVMKSAVTRQR